MESLKGAKKKKYQMFDGMSEEEVCKLKLPDHIQHNLDILVIGINPGCFSAFKGHHYAKPGNHFWKCLYLSGLTPNLMTAYEDNKLLELGIGLTNIVERTTRGSADLSKEEIKEGSEKLVAKLIEFQPKIAVFNGKQIYETFARKKNFNLGLQPELVEGTNNTHIWVMPSSSGRCSNPSRAEDKVPYYVSLKKFRDYLNGVLSEIDEKEMVFAPLKAVKNIPIKIDEETDQQSVYFRNQINANFNKIYLDKAGDNSEVKSEKISKKRKNK